MNECVTASVTVSSLDDSRHCYVIHNANLHENRYVERQWMCVVDASRIDANDDDDDVGGVRGESRG